MQSCESGCARRRSSALCVVCVSVVVWRVVGGVAWRRVSSPLLCALAARAAAAAADQFELSRPLHRCDQRPGSEHRSGIVQNEGGRKRETNEMGSKEASSCQPADAGAAGLASLLPGFPRSLSNCGRTAENACTHGFLIDSRLRVAATIYQCIACICFRLRRLQLAVPLMAMMDRRRMAPWTLSSQAEDRKRAPMQENTRSFGAALRNEMMFVFEGCARLAAHAARRRGWSANLKLADQCPITSIAGVIQPEPTV